MITYVLLIKRFIYNVIILSSPILFLAMCGQCISRSACASACVCPLIRTCTLWLQLHMCMLIRATLSAYGMSKRHLRQENSLRTNC